MKTFLLSILHLFLSFSCAADCEPLTLTEGLQVQHTLTEDGSAVTFLLTLDREAWIAFGRSEDGTMLEGEPVIAKTGYAISTGRTNENLTDNFYAPYNPGKYYIASQLDSGIKYFPDSAQTLTDATFVQRDGKTVVQFTKLLVEENELPINATGPNIFIWAVGTSNFFTHTNFFSQESAGSVTIDQLQTCTLQGAIVGSDNGGSSAGVRAWGGMVTVAIVSIVLSLWSL